VTVQTSAKRC